MIESESETETEAETDSIELLIDDFLDRYRRGERPSMNQFAEEHPRHARRIRTLIPSMLALEAFGAEFNPSEPLGRMPTILGDYRLIRSLGSGGMGTVYEALQESLGRHVALKTIPSPHPDDSARLERFRREALAAASLQHPHIVPVYGVGEHEGRHFYTMQFIQGYGLDFVLREVIRLRTNPTPSKPISSKNAKVDEGSQSSHLALRLLQGKYLPGTPTVTARPKTIDSRSSGSIPPRARTTRRGEVHYLRSIAWLGAQVAEALEYAHGQGVLHRDIKPSNLLLDFNGHVWITDFGLAKTRDDDDLTRTGDIVGTLRYMAPERFNGWSDPRSDVFALGATLYELFAFRPAFEDTDRVKLIDHLLHGRPTPLRQLDHRFPRDLETIILKALSNSSNERYPTAGRLAKDLRRFVEGRPIEARRSNVVERVWRWGRRRPAEAGAAVTVMVSLTLAVAISLAHAREQKTAAEDVGKLARQLAKERGELQVSLDESQRLLAMRDFDRGQAAFEQDQVGVGLLWMMETYRSAMTARDPSWRDIALVNLSAWSVHLPRLEGLFSQNGSINSATFSPDGRRILTGSDDGSAILWETNTARPIGQPLRHQGIVTSVAFSPDGKTLITGGTDGVVQLWDTKTLKRLSPLIQQGTRIFSLGFSPSGKTIITGGDNGRIQFWNAADGQPIGQPIEGYGNVTSIAAQPKGELVATAGQNGRIQFWNPDKGERVGDAILTHAMIISIAFSADGQTIYSGCWGGSRQVWNVTTHEPVDAKLNPLPGNNRAIAFSPKGDLYVTGGEDKSARLWDAQTHTPVGPPLYHQGPVSTVAFRSDGESFLTGGSDRSVRVWNTESCRYREPLMEIKGGGQAVAFHPGGEAFLGAQRNGIARVWSIASSQTLGACLQVRGTVTSVAYTPDGGTLLVGGDPACLLNTTIDPENKISLAHPEGAAVVAFSPDGKIAATGGADRAIRFWKANDGTPVGLPIEHAGSVDSMAFSPDGTTIASGLDAGLAQVWNLSTRRPMGQAMSHPGAVSALAFSPDGKTIVSGCEDGMVRLWNTATSSLLLPPLAHKAWVFAVAFSPDGKAVVSGSRDKTARIWDVTTGQPLGPPLKHDGPLWNVAFAPDGKSILTGDVSNTARLFEVPQAQSNSKEVMNQLEMLTGLKLDTTRGAITTLDNATWRKARDRAQRASTD